MRNYPPRACLVACLGVAKRARAVVAVAAGGWWPPVAAGGCVAVWCRDSTGRFLPVISQKTPHYHCCSGLTLFLAFAVHLAALAGPEADLAVWVFLRATPTRQSVLDSQVFFWVFFGVFRECFFCFSRVSAIFFWFVFRSTPSKAGNSRSAPAPPLRHPCATRAPPLRHPCASLCASRCATPEFLVRTPL